MAPAQSKRQSRKRRRTGAAAAAPARRPATPRPAGSPRPERTDSNPGGAIHEMGVILTGRTYGERPESWFAPVPVSEIAILAGAIGFLVGIAAHATPVLIVGIVVCTLGVVEVTAREHFSGYRSHATILAAIPAVAVLIASVSVFGTPSQRSTRELMLAAAVPVFALLFWLLRKRFLAARQSRIVRPPT